MARPVRVVPGDGAAQLAHAICAIPRGAPDGSDSNPVEVGGSTKELYVAVTIVLRALSRLKSYHGPASPTIPGHLRAMLVVLQERLLVIRPQLERGDAGGTIFGIAHANLRGRY